MKKVYFISSLCVYYFALSCKGNKVIKRGQPIENSLEEGNKIKRYIIENPWKEYMKIFDIENNHGAGIRVDLGEDAEYKNLKYRLPGGKCPVFGKGITIVNSEKSFLDPVATGNQKIKQGGFAMPETQGGSISPLSKEAVRLIFKDHPEYKDYNDIALCAKHATNYIPAGDRNTTYRHSAVFDQEKGLCYILYISAQENMGPRYCNQDKADENGMFCFKPEKDNKYKNLVYISKNVENDWEQYCPRGNLKASKFGLWVDGNCEDIQKKEIVEEVESLEECNSLAFEGSASDQPKQYEEESTDYQRLSEAVNKGDIGSLGNILVPKGSYNADNLKSKGVGYNWANYNKANKTCEIFNVRPTCLINDKDYIATTALSHPSELKDEFPCNIYRDSLQKELQEHSKRSQLHKNEKEEIIYPRMFISENKESLKCPCEPEKAPNSTCDFYICRCIERTEVVTKNNEVVKKTDSYADAFDKKKVAIIVASVLGLGILAACFFILLRKKKDEERYDKMKEVDNYGKSNSRKDEVLDPEASFWGEEKRGSHTTPVLLEKPYY